MQQKVMSVRKIIFTSFLIIQLFLLPVDVSYSNDAFTYQKEYSVLLEQAQKLASDTKISDALAAKLSIMESKTGINRAFERAISIENPFYSSLALGGIASVEISSDLNSSINHYNLALEHALQITTWTNSYASSLELLFPLLNDYPSKQAQDLLLHSKEILNLWNANPEKGYKAKLAFTKAMISIAPWQAESLLYDEALKSNHYWESIEYLAAYLTQQQPEETLRKAIEHYKAKRDWPNDRTFLQGVLIQIAKTDFQRAFDEMKNMREMDNEIAMVHLAQSQMKLNHKENAQAVLDYLIVLESDFNFTQTSIEQLQRQLNYKSFNAIDPTLIKEQEIEDFIQEPNTQKFLTLFADKEKIVFRNKAQIERFIAKCLFMTEEFQEPVFEFIQNNTYGNPSIISILMCCSVAIDKPEQALSISRKITFPSPRINYLLDAYECAFPVNPTISKWPIHAGKSIDIFIAEEQEKHNF